MFKANRGFLRPRFFLTPMVPVAGCGSAKEPRPHTTTMPIVVKTVSTRQQGRVLSPRGSEAGPLQIQALTRPVNLVPVGGEKPWTYASLRTRGMLSTRDASRAAPSVGRCRIGQGEKGVAVSKDSGAAA